jgi:multidrug resistance efflux pump
VSNAIATAKAQVEAARAEEKEAVAKVEELEAKATRLKRSLEVEAEEEGSSKRARVGDGERQAWIDARRGRALLGLAVGLGARYFQFFTFRLLTTVLYYRIWFNGSTDFDVYGECVKL